MNETNDSSKLVEAMGVFTFDLSAGQSCEYVFPPDRFSRSDLKAISMLCFPDSQSVAITGGHENVYAFSYHVGTSFFGKSDKPDDSNNLQCYVYFRQIEDPSSPRGYYQKSVVLISSSSSNFANAEEMMSLLRAVGNKFYIAEDLGCGQEVLVDAYEHIEKFGFARNRSDSSEAETKLSSLSSRSLELCSSPTSPTHAAGVVDMLYSLLDGLWHVWEAVAVGLPILVYAPGGVDTCSQAVLRVARMCAPLEFRGSVRPFLSIFDKDYPYFKSFASQRFPLDYSCICGVSSPLAFSQLAQAFQVVIVLGSLEDVCLNPSEFIPVAESSFSGSNKIFLAESVTSVSSGTRTRVMSLASRFAQPVQGYRLCIPSDTPNLSKRLVSGLAGNQPQASLRMNRAIIQRHFALLTQDLLVPFLEFTETDSCKIKSDLFGPTPQVKTFSPPLFLQQITVGVGRVLSNLSTEKLLTLYTRLMGTPGFIHWMREAQSRAGLEAILAHVDLICANFDSDEKVMWMTPAESARGLARVRSLERTVAALTDASRVGEIQKRLQKVAQFFIR